MLLPAWTNSKSALENSFDPLWQVVHEDGSTKPEDHPVPRALKT
jgi:hypothetical protein